MKNANGSRNRLSKLDASGFFLVLFLFAIPSMTKQLIIEHPLWGYPSLGAGEAAVKKVGKDSNFTRLSQENMGGAIVNTLYKHAHQKSEV